MTRAVTRTGPRSRLKDGGPGVARFDLACGRHAKHETAALVHRWARDRALSRATVDDLCVLTCNAVAPGSQPVSRSVCVLLRWTDVHHVRVDVEWRGLLRPTSDDVVDEALRTTAGVMDAVAVRWGVERGRTPRQWMVVDTRSR